MNIYEKLQIMRCELQDMKLKKSGKNKFAGYEYFELQDFIPEINKLMLKNKVTSVLSYMGELATLKLINCEKPDEAIEFTSPMAKANLKGCHEVQNLGATITYLRRYLYMTAFEIIEHDMLDGSEKVATNGTTAPNKTTTQHLDEPKITVEMKSDAAKIMELFNACETVDQLRDNAKNYTGDIQRMHYVIKEDITETYNQKMTNLKKGAK